MRYLGRLRRLLRRRQGGARALQTRRLGVRKHPALSLTTTQADLVALDLE